MFFCFARRIRSVCVVAPNGSPTTKKATFDFSAFDSSSSAPCSTKSRSAMMIDLP